MAIQIVVPELGESVVEATVGRWLKNEGDHVEAGETIVELETDKVDLEVAAERAGTLATIEKKQGEDVRIGDVLGVIEAEEKTSGGKDQSKVPEPPSGQALGTQERKGPVAAAEPPLPTTMPEQISPVRERSGPVAPTPPQDGDKVTPVARRLAQEQGVDPAQVSGTGPGGRVTRQDVETFIEKQKGQAAPAAPVAAPPAPAPRPPSAEAGREERVRMSRRRRTIAGRLLEASQTTAMLTTFNEIDMSAVMEIRNRRRDSFKERYGVGLGITSFFVKASIGALKAFPALNAEIQGDEIVYKHYYDIGIAVGAAEGLVVPVLRAADQMTFAEIEKAIKEFAHKSESGTLSVADLRGGTFTVTNGGVFGSLLSTPILNVPQVGILGLHKVEDRPVAVNGQVVVRPMMYVALSYDHRIVDGREAVQCLVRIKQLVEDPESMLLEA
ncbi:MAG: 2-oxoglutarate dehydrogenase complex dihydrolipoyllysine-residue succinyltransferase [Acidobacteriota bacterium]